MVLAVDQAGLEVDDFIAGDLALARLDLDRVLDRRDVLARHAATDDLVGEHDARTRLARLEHHLHFGELARAAGLLLVRVGVFDAAARPRGS